MIRNGKYFSIIAIIIGLTACKKDAIINSEVLPNADFSVQGITPNNVITIGTYDQYLITNTSTNGNAYLWNFGNDSSSQLENPVLSYPTSGSYKLTLTVTNKTGQKSVITKNVKVLDRVVKQVIITGLAQLNYPIFQSLNYSNVWAEVKLTSKDSVYGFPSNPVMSSLNAPVIYKSPIIANFDSTKIPYIIDVSKKIILDYPALMLRNFNPQSANKNFGYGLELYAQNSRGTYLLSSSYQGFYETQSSLGAQVRKADILNNIFIAGYANVELICDYE